MITTMNVNRRNSPLPTQEGFASTSLPLTAMVPEISDDVADQDCCQIEETHLLKQTMADMSEPIDHVRETSRKMMAEDSEQSHASSVLSTFTPEGVRLRKSAVDDTIVNDLVGRITDECDAAEPMQPNSKSAALNRVLTSMVESIMLAIRSDTRYNIASNRFVDEVDPFQGNDDQSGARTGGSAAYNLYMNFYRLCRSNSDLCSHIGEMVTVICSGISSPEINAALTGTLLSALQALLESPFESAIHRKDIYDKIIDAAIHCVFEETSILTSSMHSIPAASGVEVAPKPSAAASVVNMPIAASAATRRRSSATIQQPLTLANTSSGHGQQSFYEDSASRTITAGNGSQRFTHALDDEKAIFKLLQMVAAVIRNIMAVTLTMPIESTQLEELLELCAHVQFRSKAASALLKQAAAHCEMQILRGVFTTKITSGQTEFCCSTLEKLSSHLVPTSLQYGDDNSNHIKSSSGSFRNETGVNYGVVVHSLSLIKSIVDMICMGGNVIRSDPPMTQVLEQKVTRAIITLAIHTSNHVTLKTCIQIVNQLLNLLGLCRLKCELEVFIHAALLRRLDGMDVKPASLEEKEIVLEHMHEICVSPGLGISNVALSPVNMVDIYLNYDCDCDSSNLFELIMLSLGKSARPASAKINEEISDRSSENTCEFDRRSVVSSYMTNDGIATYATTPSVSASPATKASPPEVASNGPSINHLSRLALNCILATIKSIEDLCHATNEAHEFGLSDSHRGIRALDQEQVQIKRMRKLSLDKIVRTFNARNPDKGEWLDVAVEEGIIEATTDHRAAAEFLFRAHLDIEKQRIGVYLSRGPESGFPFHAGVRSHFAGMHNFRDLSFAKALRKFLSKFRLPGEAQCIDRLMEAFSKEYFEQNSGSTFFKNSDAVYVLAFSTIMLNTDRHNPTIKADRRMTLDQFLRNNRGINSGEDLPEDFLTDLYDQIKERELQIRTDVGQFMVRNCDDSAIYWDEIQDRKQEIDEAVSLSMGSRSTGCNLVAKDMFHLTKNPAYFATVGIFLKSTDDRMVVSALRGMQRLSALATSFQCTKFSADILFVYLSQGHEYISKCISQDISSTVGRKGIQALTETSRHRHSNSMDSATLSDDTARGEDNDVVPLNLLGAGLAEGNKFNVNGSVRHRGLLALDSGLILLRTDPTAASEIWSLFVQCLCGMRDARVLPPSLSDLDDFADCNGNILPLSSFAKASQKRLEEYHRSLSEKENSKQKGWFRALFRKGKTGDLIENTNSDADERVSNTELSVYAKALLGVVDAADIEGIVNAASSKLQDAAIGALLEVLDAYPFENDPAGEQHAVFTLEIAARALLSNRKRAESLFLLFLGKFENILCKTTNIEGDVPEAPFVIERIVVTILRCSIHLYEFPELRPHLRASLQLLTMTLPKDFVRSISDRISCGLAIILRTNYPYFEPQHNQEWSLISEMFDILANYATSRVLVFDGIASTVEHAMPNFDPLTATSSILQDSATELDISTPSSSSRPGLSIEACSALSRILTRFVLGFYQGDQSLSVPAMLCLEKVYRRKVEILLLAPQQPPDESTDELQISASPVDFIAAVPDKELWQNVVVAMYSVCRSTDPDASTEATQCYRRLVLRTSIDAIAVDQWITILYLMVNKQPPVVSEVSRGNTFSVLGQLLLRLLPQIRCAAEYREDLEEFLVQFAALAEENIAAAIELRQRNGPGRKSVLFEKTIQTLTYISNHIMSEDDWEDGAFRIWTNETLMHPIELAAQSDLRFKTGKVVTTRDALEEEDDVSEISDSVAGDEYGREEMSQSEVGY